MSNYKNTTVITVGFVGPNVNSKTQLGPGVYSLNKRSNVPYVGLVGSSGFKKVMSWGELCEVPKGELVTVSNASYHGGDIFVNKGPDMCNRPSRITVPVSFVFTPHVTGEGTINAWTGVYPCDTRAAKRAYLNIDAFVDTRGGDLTMYVRGRRLDGSMACANSLQEFTPPFGPGVGFLSALIYPVNTELSYIPLGQGAPVGDDTRPHNLLDAGDAFIDVGFDPTLDKFMVWPASKNVFGFPPQSGPAPGTWYVIEYD